jgi:large subunit ribosomal protein L5
MSRLRKIYDNEIKNGMIEKFQYKNVHQVPKMEKIVVSCCTRDALANSKVVQSVKNDLSMITGQAAVEVKAKKSVATFKLREGQKLGARVTLRGTKMYEFFDRLVSVSLPRVRDFRGLSPKGFDGAGNYNMGMKEQIIFPEINYDKIDKIRGLGITIVTTAKTDDEGRELLTQFGMPFKGKKD